ncbi:hypothetical protein HU200_055584 [Digitaria exilis]|uniref:TNase-like domain-containing protein n=1 Tax=Digitaria exilis TaxID=1010633 RepID=A0A835E1F8_9POAL|nr:hypothetical protein HU200_055584 [Digitaria exilis]
MGRHRSPTHLLGPESFEIRLRGPEGSFLLRTRSRYVVGQIVTEEPQRPTKRTRCRLGSSAGSSGQLPPPSSRLRRGAGLAAYEGPTRSPDTIARCRRMPGEMNAAPGHRRERRGSFHVRAGAAGKRAPPSLVLVCCIGAISLLASSGRALAPKKFCLGSIWCVSLAPVPCKPQGVKQVPNMRGEQVLTKKYRIRLRGIDAPESLMPYGKEAKEELVRLVQGKSLKISLYDSDRYGRLVGDVDCNGVSVQEHMLKKGLAWHYTAYDHRMELSKWESQARMSRTGLWALPDPEKPWEWRRKRRIGAM